MVSFCRNRVCRSWTSRRISVTGLLLGIERIAQAVADPRECEHRQREENGRREDQVRGDQHHCKPSWIIDPHEGVGGCTPRPSSARPDSAMIAPGIPKLSETSSGPQAFGMM